ncbi:hypothetical protein C8J56DRAFT_880028 [Mycena floridula]|nr:hypothetical protein C8J56DRAFT_880028 [Mycena floridula]
MTADILLGSDWLRDCAIHAILAPEASAPLEHDKDKDKDNTVFESTTIIMDIMPLFRAKNPKFSSKRHPTELHRPIENYARAFETRVLDLVVLVFTKVLSYFIYLVVASPKEYDNLIMFEGFHLLWLENGEGENVVRCTIILERYNTTDYDKKGPEIEHNGIHDEDSIHDKIALREIVVGQGNAANDDARRD